MNEIINAKIPIMQCCFVYNDIKRFLESKNISNYTVEISIGSVRVLIKKLFFNVKQLQTEIDQLRPLGVQIVCRKYNLKEWLINFLIKKLKIIN